MFNYTQSFMRSPLADLITNGKEGYVITCHHGTSKSMSLTRPTIIK